MLLCLLVFIIFTVAIKTIDTSTVYAVDYTGSKDTPDAFEIGFSSVNIPFAEKIGYSDFWYTLSELLGYISVATVLVFAFIGLRSLVKSRSLSGVDSDIIALGIFYIVVFLLYVLFDKIAINYRPVITDVENMLEASYPSSHTLLGLSVMLTAAAESRSMLKKPVLRRVVPMLLALTGVLTVISRLLSGVHWFTDIIGGIILSACLVSFWDFLRCQLKIRCAKH